MNIRRINFLISFVTVALLLLAACNVQPQQTAALAGDPKSSPSTADNDQLIADISAKDQQAGDLQSVDQRIVLKDANLEIVVDDVATTLDSIAALAETMGGWVITSNTAQSARGSNGVIFTGSIAIRVPAAQFTAVLTHIKSQATTVESETITGTDVTQDYTDLTSQLTNLKAAESQLQNILDKTETTESVIQVFNELVRVRGEIETAQGRINYYNEASRFSSISVALRVEKAPIDSVQVDGGWSPAATVKGAFNTLVNILQWLINLIIIFIVLVLPLLLLLGITVWIIRKLARRYGWLNSRADS